MQLDNEKNNSIKFFCKNYLIPKDISYDLSFNHEDESYGVYFSEEGLTFNMLLRDDDVLVSARGIAPLFTNEKALRQVKEYILRCNHDNCLSKFDFFNIIDGKLNIVCGFDKFFCEDNMKFTLIDGMAEIKRMMRTYYPGIIEIASEKISVKEAILKYLYKGDDYE